MERVLSAALSNAVLVAILAVVVLAIDRAVHRPALAHSLWLLLLLKLFTPPFLPLPQFWTSSTPVRTPPAAGGRDRVPAVPLAEPVPVASLTFKAQARPSVGPATQVTRAAAAYVPVHWTTVAGGAWLAGSAISLSWTLFRLKRASRLLHRALPAPEALNDRVAELAQRIGVRRVPEVRFLRGVVSPMLWAASGAPRLILPAGLWERLDHSQQDALLVHELAHLRRRDHWVRQLEVAVACVYWWHPVVRWMRRALRDAEERCCDAWVVWAIPGVELAYATALLDTLDFLADDVPPLPLAASGMWHVASLQARLAVIIRGGAARRLSTPGAAGVLAVAGILFPMSAPHLGPRCYKITDLGTLGGETSTPLGLNNAGQVVGSSLTRTRRSHAFVTKPNQPINPATDDLGHDAGTDTDSIARGINDRGQVLLFCAQPGSAHGEMESFVVGEGQITSVGSLAIESFGVRPEERETRGDPPATPLGPAYIQYVGAEAINDLGQVVGSITDNARHYRAFRTRPGSPIDPATDDLGDLGFTIEFGRLYSAARDINRRGQVVGTTVGPNRWPHAFRTAPNRPINPETDDLGTLGGVQSEANAINDAGEVVGSASTGSSIAHAFRTKPNRPIDPTSDDLGTLGGPRSSASAINKSGIVVGSADDSTYADGRYHEILIPRDNGLTDAIRVPRFSRAFLHDGTTMHDLNDLIPSDAGWFLESAVDINDRGQIIGNGINRAGEYHGYLLTPVNELDGLILLVSGTCISGLGFRLIRVRGAA